MLCSTAKRNVVSLARRSSAVPSIKQGHNSLHSAACTTASSTLTLSRPHHRTQKSCPVQRWTNTSRQFTTSLTRKITPLNNVSHVQGPQDVPLLSHTLGEFWDSIQAKYPTSPALISRHETRDQHQFDSEPGHVVGEGEDSSRCLRWTFEEMGRGVDALARGLLHQGVKKGDRVGVFLGNNSTYACLQWATAKVRSQHRECFDSVS